MGVRVYYDKWKRIYSIDIHRCNRKTFAVLFSCILDVQLKMAELDCKSSVKHVIVHYKYYFPGAPAAILQFLQHFFFTISS